MTSFRILGPVEAWSGDQRVPLGGRRQLKLFAFLVLNANRAVSSDALIDAVWGPSRSATDHRLHMAITRLRKALAPVSGSAGPRVRTVGGGYLLSLGSGELDAEVFEALLGDGRRTLEAGEPARAAAVLDRALGLWRGPALAEVAFEDFAQPEIRRLDELRLEGLETRIETGLQLGRHEELTSELERLLAEHPSRERIAAQLMLALYRCGRQGDALEVYQRTRVHLAQELGLEPGPALRTMQNQILRQAPSIDAGNLSGPWAERVDAGDPSTHQERLVGPPIAPTPTIGRHREIEAVCGLLESREAQLVTLTGPGGVGKTRVALAVAHTMQTTMPGGVGWVELAGVGRADDVEPTVAQALAVKPGPDETVGQALHLHLAGKRFLLVVDNFEHVLDAAVLVAGLLAASPGLSVLATSREPLDLSAEHRVLIAPLALPDVSDDVTVAKLESTDATALFLAAMRRRDDRFQATPAEAPMIARICTRLEGLPLALELAAARAGSLGVRSLAERVEEAVSDLGTGPRDAPVRQQTLAATIDWSYRLLDEEQSRALVRFAVFAGGASLDAARVVTGATRETLEALVAKNLINRRTQADGSGRLLMLEAIREYALGRLAEDPAHDQIRTRQADWFLALARRAADRLWTPEQGVWLSRLFAETDNLRAVLAWSLERDVALGILLASALMDVWYVRGLSHELIPWLERALASPATIDTRTRARGLCTLAAASLSASQCSRAREPLEESLLLFRGLADRAGEARVLLDLGTVAWSEGSFDTAMDLSEVALAINRDAGNRYEIAHALHRIGDILRERGDLERAAATLEEALAIVHDLGDRFRFALIAHSLGDLALDQLHLERAGERYQQALRAAVAVGNESTPLYCLAGRACIAALQGDSCTAGRLWAAAETAEAPRSMFTHERRRYERILAPLSKDPRFQEGQEAGRDLPVDELVRELVSVGSPIDGGQNPAAISSPEPAGPAG